MGRIDELVSAEFAGWEQRGRGWQVWPEPVRPEPPFQEFTGYRLAQSQFEVDDGRRPGFLASLFDSFEKKINSKPATPQEETVDPEPIASLEPLTAEFVASLPASLDVSEDALRAFVDSLHVCEEPTAFELFGSHESVTIQFASSSGDAPTLKRHLDAFLPKLPFTSTQEKLDRDWNNNDGVGFIVDFGLAHEFMLPLHTGHAVDPFVGLVAVLNELQRDEMAVFQVLFQSVQNPWPGSVWRSVTDANGKALFVNRLQFIPGTKEKLETPLYGVVVRAAAKAENFERAAAIVRDMASSLRTFYRHEGNRLIPLTNDDYPFEDHAEDLCRRQSRRSGMILNREELLGFVHLPSEEVRSPKLRREIGKTKAAPSSVSIENGLLLGFNSHAGRISEVRLTSEQRVRHAHVIGASGTGKSTLLFNLIRQDIEAGQGVALLDPHGDLVDRILGIIPPNRIDDVVLVDPSDEEFSVGFNILSAHSDLEKNLLASDLVSVFQRLSTSWGDQMGSVLNNAILAFLESSKGGTLADLQRFLIEPAFRNDFLTSVQDSQVLYYWKKAFPQLTGNKSVGPVLTRLGAFLERKPVRYMVSQKENRLDFGQIMDTGKIFLAKLSQGQIGNENAYLLGSFFVSKFQQLAMSRQSQTAASRMDFWFYIDEFHNFITPSMAQILTGARKYRLGLILAHQELHQLQRESEVASAVLSNPYTRICFRVGGDDARKLGDGFSFFDSKDIQNLPNFQAICRVERSDCDFNLAVPNPPEIDEADAAEVRKRVITASRQKYGVPRKQIEAEQTPPLEELEPISTPRPSKAMESAKISILKQETAPAAPEHLEIPEASDLPQQKQTIESAEEIKPEPVDGAKAPRSTQDRGIGGHQHNIIRERIESVARELGFYAAREKLTKDGGKIDLALERPGQTIACEISLMTTVDHEVGNVKKCLQAGFEHVAVICTYNGRLEKIAKAVSGCLSSSQAAHVGYYLPDHFIAYIGCLKAPEAHSDAIQNQETVSLGKYKVRRHVATLTADERKTQEEAAFRMIAETMRKKKET